MTPIDDDDDEPPELVLKPNGKRTLQKKAQTMPINTDGIDDGDDNEPPQLIKRSGESASQNVLSSKSEDVLIISHQSDVAPAPKRRGGAPRQPNQKQGDPHGSGNASRRSRRARTEEDCGVGGDKAPGHANAPDDKEESKLHAGWEAVWSHEHGSHYYWNLATDEVSWERPTGLSDPEKEFELVKGDDLSSEASQPRTTAMNGHSRLKVASSDVVARQQHLAQSTSKTRSTSAFNQRLHRRAPVMEVKEEEPLLPPEKGPKLSYSCVCQAVAEVLGLSLDEIRTFGMDSVDDWRANFAKKKWKQIREKALKLESEQVQKLRSKEKKKNGVGRVKDGKLCF